MTKALSILIIEDSPEDAELLLHALGKGGYGPIRHAIVDSEPTMRAALADRDWDVITSDHSMPGFSAPEGLAIAVALCPQVPFIIVSSEIELGLVISLMRNGTEDYVLKTQLARLPAVIERSLREARARHANLDSLAALAASETRYRRLFEAAQDGILIVDPELAIAPGELVGQGARFSLQGCRTVQALPGKVRAELPCPAFRVRGKELGYCRTRRSGQTHEDGCDEGIAKSGPDLRANLSGLMRISSLTPVTPSR